MAPVLFILVDGHVARGVNMTLCKCTALRVTILTFEMVILFEKKC